MGFISQTLGITSMENVKLGKEVRPNAIQYSLQDSIKAIEPQVKFSELEMAYKMDAIYFNSINKSTQMIMAGGFKEWIHKKSGVAKKFKEFFENIGEIGNDITFEELLESIFRDEMIYGNAYVEIIYNEDDSKILDLAIIDPKKIDYAKTADGKIILDNYGKELGYVIKLSQGNYADGDEIPSKYDRIINREEGTIFILSKRVCHFKLYPIGDRRYGTGLIEPSYRSVIYKKNIEKGQANSIYARGFSPLIAYVGNERKMATPKDINDVLEKLKTLTYQRYEAFPNWVEVKPIEMNASDLTTTALKDLRSDQITALSLPDAAASGQGQTANKQTLTEQMVLWEFTLKDIIKQTMSYFKKYILKPIDKLNNYGGVPEPGWGELRAEEIEVTADKIIRLLTSKSGNITPEFIVDLEEDLRKILNIKISGKKPKPIPTQIPGQVPGQIPVNPEKDKEIKEIKEINKDTKKDIESKLSKIDKKLEKISEESLNEKLKAIDKKAEENKVLISKPSLSREHDLINEEIDIKLKEKENKILENKQIILEKLRKDVEDEK